MFVSVRGRVLINVEALNMTESVGNYVKHRRVPVILPETYTTCLVPAISGESIAHGYQEVLANEAKKNNNILVCNLCKNGIFLKSADEAVIIESFNIKIGNSKEKDKILKNWLKENLKDNSSVNNINENNIHYALESAIIKNCIVEDLGGFMYAEKTFAGVNLGNLRRTSLFSTGYMIPTKECLESTVIEPQLHTRFVQGMEYQQWQKKYQVPYYVELSSAVYTFSFDIDTKYIGCATFSYEKAGDSILLTEEEEKELEKLEEKIKQNRATEEDKKRYNELFLKSRKKRIEVALDSMQKFITELMFGAKKTRFLPVVEWESLVIAVSDDVWTVPSPNSANYIKNAIEKLNKINSNTKLFVYINPLIFEDTSIYVKKKTEELLNSFYEALEEFKKRLEERGDADKIDWDEFKKKKLEEFLEKKVDEVVNSSDMRYTSKIQEKYAKVKQMLQENKKIKIFENFEECIAEAVKEAKKRGGITIETQK